jgi:hypothetical protein
MPRLLLILLGFLASTLGPGQLVTDRRADRAAKAQSEALRPPTADIELLVRQALEDCLAGHNLPDIALLGKATSILIREELPSAGLKLSRSALPKRDGYDFRLISVPAARSEAERTHAPVYFITIDSPAITGGMATIWLGVDVEFPRDPNRVQLCCCEGEGHFRRVDDRWTFVKWATMKCS